MSYADDKGLRDALRQPFPKEQIGKLPKTQKRPELDFVGHAAVTDRLNRVAPDWTYVVDEVSREHYVDENGIERDGEWWIRGTFTVGGVSRVEYGDGKDRKEAIGNFIRRGAMRFGVALDLWSREELTGAGVDSASSPAPSPNVQGRPGGEEETSAPIPSDGSVSSPAGNLTLAEKRERCPHVKLNDAPRSGFAECEDCGIVKPRGWFEKSEQKALA